MTLETMKVSIIGTGYVGLVSGACLAEVGHDVTCVDIDAGKVERINRGDPPIHERGLAELLGRHIGTGLRATTALNDAVRATDITLIAVGTPFDGERIDLRFIREAATAIGHAIATKPGYHVVAIKSTVVPGTTEDVVAPLLEAASGKQAGRDFGLGMNPEFLREGEAVRDFLEPDRIVLGGIDRRSLDTLAELYRPFTGVDVLRVSPRTAETIKYAANSLLATMISFSNEIGNLCAALDNVDVVEVLRGVHLDKRLSPLLDDGSRIMPGFTTYLEAGCGFGGSCFPKDVKALVAHGSSVGAPMRILEQVLAVNGSQPLKMIELLRRNFADLSGLRVAVLGLAFKPGTDDLRESPALRVVEELLREGVAITAYDPVAGTAAAATLAGAGEVVIADSIHEAVEGAAAVLLLTRWPEFSELPQLLAALPDPPLLVDGRRMIPHHLVPRYEGIGRGSNGNRRQPD